MKRFRLNRPVTTKECDWLDRDYRHGELLFEYTGPTYGCISDNGIACTEKPGETPFFEFPADALTDTMVKVKKTWHLVSNGKETSIIHGYRDFINTMSKGGPWQSISPGFDTKKKLIEHQGILKDPCVHCGDLVDTSYVEPVKSRFIATNMCFTCDFWLDYANNADNPSVARIAGKHYMVGSESAGGFRGFGGRRFEIEFFDGRNVVTTNLWYQGEIPERFKDKMPDNAKFIQS